LRYIAFIGEKFTVNLRRCHKTLVMPL
jgi:hypothetical protein